MVLYIDGSNSSAKIERVIKSYAATEPSMRRLQPRPQQQHDRVKIVENLIVIINKGSEWQSIPDHKVQYAITIVFISIMIHIPETLREKPGRFIHRRVS